MATGHCSGMDGKRVKIATSAPYNNNFPTALNVNGNGKRSSMYPILLSIHSLVRWLVLLSLIYAIYRACRGWLKNKEFTPFDNTVRHTTATIAHIQMTIGVILYIISPVVGYFLHNFKEAIHERQFRFFGMEHSIMMLTGVILISVGSASSKRKTNDRSKFKTMAIFYIIALLIILSSIPWAFSPLVSRPHFRLPGKLSVVERVDSEDLD